VDEPRSGARMRAGLALGAGVVLGLAAFGQESDRPTKDTGVLQQIFRSHPEWFQAVLDSADRHRLQVLYTRIDRDAANRPLFRSYGYRLTDEYFYPASTVKLPAAILALEKLNDLAVPGLTRDTPLRIGVGSPGQTPVKVDPTREDGRPTIGHYVKKVFLISDNDAYNRLYEFLGQREINERLWRRGFSDARLLRRLEAGLDPAQERETNPFEFFEGERVIYRQPAARNSKVWWVDRPGTRQGLGYVQDGRVVPEPLDFRFSNYISIESLQAILRIALFPESVPEERRFRLTEDDSRFLLRYMSMLPRESREPAYPDREAYPDSYVKFFLFGDAPAPIPPNVRIFNKVGQAYGYLIDNAYVVDFDAGVEFLLTAVIQVNRNRIYNDDSYEYDQVGFPFLANLGRAVMEYERGRDRPRRPDLSRFRADN
jgi:hypothetical protein